MKGTNQLHLNEATLVAAMQEYLDSRAKRACQQVESVKWNGATYTVTVKEFTKEDLL